MSSIATFILLAILLAASGSSAQTADSSPTTPHKSTAKPASKSRAKASSKAHAKTSGATVARKKSSAKTLTAARHRSRTAAKPRPHLTPASASGFRDAAPGSLKAMAIDVLERNSLAQQQALADYAKRHPRETTGVLADLVLGYHAYQAKHYPEAAIYLQAARMVVSPLQDYGEYYLALTYIAEGDRDSAGKLLDGFAARYPSSSLLAPATLKEAESQIASGHASQAIPLLTDAAITLPQPAAGVLLGQAYRRDNQGLKAVQALQTVYYLTPTSAQAEAAERELEELRTELGASYPVPSDEMRMFRADHLALAKRCREAQGEYRVLATAASDASTRDKAKIRAASCAYEAGDSRAALGALKNAEVTDPEADAERTYALAAIYRHLDQTDTMEQQVEALGREHPQSDWYQKALFLVGNHYLVSQNRSHAADFYTTLYQQFPQGDLAAESHWRVAWRRYRERNLPEARRLFEEHIRNYPTSPQVSASIYWLGRTFEQESPASAAACFRKLVDDFPNYYYGQVARDHLAAMPARTEEVNPELASLLDPIRRPLPDSPVDEKVLPVAARERRTRAKLLESAWLIDLAIDELKSGIASDGSSKFLLGREVAHLEEARGRYHIALSYAKRLLNGYFALDIADIPHDDWELLFPLPYWDHIKERADLSQLDPYLVAGLIRQESEFNPDARSHSNALGLMQLMPATAKRMAKMMSGRCCGAFRLASLQLPEYNVAYGTFYLRQVLDQFNGSKEEALAAYNAGENRVVEWLADGNFDEPAEFVESIPFTETREYVQAVMRNAALYRILYQDEQPVPSPDTTTPKKTPRRVLVPIAEAH